MKHTTLHRELAAYTDLMHWCKAMDRKAFMALTKIYTSSLSKLYERDIKLFLEDAKLRINAGKLLLLYTFIQVTILKHKELVNRMFVSK